MIVSASTLNAPEPAYLSTLEITIEYTDLRLSTILLTIPKMLANIFSYPLAPTDEFTYLTIEVIPSTIVVIIELMYPTALASTVNVLTISSILLAKSPRETTTLLACDTLDGEVSTSFTKV